MPKNADTFFELPCIEQSLVGIPMELSNIRVFDRGDAFAMEYLLDVENAFLHLLRGSGRD